MFVINEDFPIVSQNASLFIEKAYFAMLEDMQKNIINSEFDKFKYILIEEAKKYDIDNNFKILILEGNFYVYLSVENKKDVFFVKENSEGEEAHFDTTLYAFICIRKLDKVLSTIDKFYNKCKKDIGFALKNIDNCPKLIEKLYRDEVCSIFNESISSLTDRYEKYIKK